MLTKAVHVLLAAVEALGKVGLVLAYVPEQVLLVEPLHVRRA